MILGLSILLFFIGLISGLFLAIKSYPNREIKKLFRVFLKEGFSVGEWKHYSDLVDHDVKVIVKPNCETLYSTTFLKFGNNTHNLVIPSIDEYFSVSFINSNSDVIGYIKNDDLNKEGVSKFYLSKEGLFSENHKKFDLPKFCWVIVRYGIPGSEGLESVRKVQEKIKLETV